MKKLILVLAIVLTAHSASAGTAFWTGGMVQVSTVTYQRMWKCEYNYMGTVFYRLFSGMCPMSVEVY